MRISPNMMLDSSVDAEYQEPVINSATMLGLSPCDIAFETHAEWSSTMLTSRVQHHVLIYRIPLVCFFVYSELFVLHTNGDLW